MEELDEDDWVRTFAHPIFFYYNWSPDDVYRKSSFDDLLFLRTKILETQLLNDMKTIAYHNSGDPKATLESVKKEYDNLRGTVELSEEDKKEQIERNLETLRGMFGKSN